MSLQRRVLLIASAMALPACGGTANVGGTGGAGGAAGAGGVAGAAGAAGAGAAFVDAGTCVPPAIEEENPMEFVDVEWCNSERSCATCSWDFFYPETLVPTVAPCIFPELTCPGSSGITADASLTSCASQLSAASLQGVVVQLVIGQSSPSTSSLDFPPLGCFSAAEWSVQSDGGEPAFDSAACLLGGFRCVPACSACP